MAWGKVDDFITLHHSIACIAASRVCRRSRLPYDDLHAAAITGIWRYAQRFGIEAVPDRSILTGYAFAACRWYAYEQTMYRFRRGPRQARPVHGILPPDIAAPGPDEERPEQSVIAALSILPDRQARLVSLRVYSGLGIRQVAREMGITHNAARSLWRRARITLRQALIDRGYDGHSKSTDTRPR